MRLNTAIANEQNAVFVIIMSFIQVNCQNLDNGKKRQQHWPNTESLNDISSMESQYSFFNERRQSFDRDYVIHETQPHAFLVCSQFTFISEIVYALQIGNVSAYELPRGNFQRNYVWWLASREDGVCLPLGRCLGHSACAFQASNEFCGSDPLPGKRKVFMVKVKCEQKRLHDENRKNATVAHLYYKSLLDENVVNYTAVKVHERILPVSNVFQLNCPRSQQELTTANYAGDCNFSHYMDLNHAQLRTSAGFILSRIKTKSCRIKMKQVLCSQVFSCNGQCLPPFMFDKGSDRLSWQTLPRNGIRPEPRNVQIPQHSALIPVKLAFYILANSHPHAAMQLLQQIYSVKHYYVIHVDRRQLKTHQLISSQLLRELPAARNVKLLPLARSFAASWGSDRVVRAELECIEELLRMGAWDFAIGVSEQDLPLRPVSDLSYILAPYRRHNLLHPVEMKFHRPTDESANFPMFGCEDFIFNISRVSKSRIENTPPIYGHSMWKVLSNEFCEAVVSNDGWQLQPNHQQYQQQQQHQHQHQQYQQQQQHQHQHQEYQQQHQQHQEYQQQQQQHHQHQEYQQQHQHQHQHQQYEQQHQHHQEYQQQHQHQHQEYQQQHQQHQEYQQQHLKSSGQYSCITNKCADHARSNPHQSDDDSVSGDNGDVCSDNKDAGNDSASGSSGDSYDKNDNVSNGNGDRVGDDDSRGYDGDINRGWAETHADNVSNGNGGSVGDDSRGYDGDINRGWAETHADNEPTSVYRWLLYLLKIVVIPDEHHFATLLMNSRFRKTLLRARIHYLKSYQLLHKDFTCRRQHLAEFCGKGPGLILPSDVRELLKHSTRYMFARKFSPDVNDPARIALLDSRKLDTNQELMSHAPAWFSQRLVDISLRRIGINASKHHIKIKFIKVLPRIGFNAGCGVKSDLSEDRSTIAFNFLLSFTLETTTYRALVAAHPPSQCFTNSQLTSLTVDQILSTPIFKNIRDPVPYFAAGVSQLYVEAWFNISSQSENSFLESSSNRVHGLFFDSNVASTKVKFQLISENDIKCGKVREIIWHELLSDEVERGSQTLSARSPEAMPTPQGQQLSVNVTLNCGYINAGKYKLQAFKIDQFASQIHEVDMMFVDSEGNPNLPNKFLTVIDIAEENRLDFIQATAYRVAKRALPTNRPVSDEL